MRYLLAALGAAMLSGAAMAETVPVGPGNFTRAETESYMARMVRQGAFGKIVHRREHVRLDQQAVIRMNLDTLYSSGVFDMTAGPVTITVPEAPDGRYVSAQVMTQDHHTVAVYHAGTYTFSQEEVGTRYAALLIRVFADATDPADVAVARTLQDMISVEQPAGPGAFEPVDFDKATLDRTRRELLDLGALPRNGSGRRMGTPAQVDPIAHLIATAAGWGLLPEEETAYFMGLPVEGKEGMVHTLTLKDVPAEAFWSVTVYNREGFMVPNDLGRNAINNVSASSEKDGSVRIQFGGCEAQTRNCIPVMGGWNYALRLYRASPEVMAGNWAAPVAMPVE